MPKWCAVPNCKTGSEKEQTKCSVFCVPKDTVAWKKWEDAIPGIVKLHQTDVVCEKHFDDKDISRGWVKFDETGHIIARATYKYPRLKEFAVPTKFSDVTTANENCNLSHECAKLISDGHLVTADNSCANLERNSRSVENRCYVSGTALVASPAPDNGTTDIGMSFSPIEISSRKPPIAESSIDRKPFKVAASLEISEKILEGNAFTSAELSAYVPRSWSFCDMHTENVQGILFAYAVTKLENGEHCPVTQKCVTLGMDGTLKYFVYGRYVDPQDKKLERILKKKEMLTNVLQRFKGMNVCSGLGDVSINLAPADEIYQDYVSVWRCKRCSLLSAKKRCNSCVTSRKCILQRAARLKDHTMMKRIGNVSNPVDQCKLLAMRMKVRRERRQTLRAKDRVKHLMAFIKAQEEQIAKMQNSALNKKALI